MFEQISGTALVLDEIINHVQSLQRQVEVCTQQLTYLRLIVYSYLIFILENNGGMVTY